MNYTVYKITNKLDGKVYIGTHKTDNLDDGYMGSGKYLKLAIAKHGEQNFSKEILFVFSTSEEMFAKEAELVNEEFLTNENTYNLRVGGFGGFDYINSNNESKIWKQKGRRNSDISIMEKYGVKYPSQIEHVRKEHSERISSYHKIGILPKPPNWKGKHHSDKTISKMRISMKDKNIGKSNSQFGTEWITNGIENRKVRRGSIYPEGFSKGRVINK